LYWLPQIPYSSRNYFFENSFVLNKDEGLCKSLQVMLCKFLMICIIQIDAGLLSYHNQLSWLACHWILYSIIYNNETIIILEWIIGYVEFNNNFIHRNTTSKSVFVPIMGGTFKATPTAEQLNNLLMERQNLFCWHFC
jgi:hypothetical protein